MPLSDLALISKMGQGQFDCEVDAHKAFKQEQKAHSLVDFRGTLLFLHKPMQACNATRINSM